MSTIMLRAMVKNTNSSKKFDSLTFTNSGLFLKTRNQPEIAIPFTDVDQIYIKKHKLHPLIELVGITFPFLLVFMAIQYLSFGLMILVSIISILPVFIWIVNYKWYRLYVRLNDGSSFRKKIATNVKTEYFSKLEKVRAEYLSYNFYDNTLATA